MRWWWIAAAAWAAACGRRFFSHGRWLRVGRARRVAIASAAWSQQATAGIDAVWFTGGALADDGAWTKALAFADAGGTVVVTGDSQAPTQCPRIGR